MASKKLQGMFKELSNRFPGSNTILISLSQAISPNVVMETSQEIFLSNILQEKLRKGSSEFTLDVIMQIATYVNSCR
jgi:hypothetical protein